MYQVINQYTYRTANPSSNPYIHRSLLKKAHKNITDCNREK